MPRILLVPLMAYAAAGLIISLAVHLFSFTGVQLGGNAIFMALHIGIFPLWIPVAILSSKMAGRMAWGVRGRDYLDRVMSGAPDWMRQMTRVFYVYAFVNFAIFFVWTLSSGGKAAGADSAFSNMVWRGFSGHWMLFYSAGLAILAAAYRKAPGQLEPECPNGHVAALGDRYCAVCGAPVQAPAPR